MGNTLTKLAAITPYGPTGATVEGSSLRAENSTLRCSAMQEEIFGPILPILEISGVEDVLDFVNARPSPLGLYRGTGDGAKRNLGARKGSSEIT